MISVYFVALAFHLIQSESPLLARIGSTCNFLIAFSSENFQNWSGVGESNSSG